MSTETGNQQRQPTMVVPQPSTGAPTAPPYVPQQNPGRAFGAPTGRTNAVSTANRQRRLVGATIWGFALGASGLVLGTIALFTIMGGSAPGWFEPVFGAVGVVGLALIIAAFVTVQRRLTPWLLLGASTALFIAGVVLLGTV